MTEVVEVVETETVVVDGEGLQVEVTSRDVVTVVEVGVAGPQGTQGEPGADSTVPGPPGAPGGSFSYVHDQAIPSATWTIVHGLGGYPNITVVDSSGREVIGDSQYVDANTIVASFVAAFAGAAYLS